MAASEFQSMLGRCGCTFDAQMTPTVDDVQGFKRKVQKESKVMSFTEDAFRDFLDNSQMLRKSLAPLRLTTGGTGSHSGQRDTRTSLMRVLLQNPDCQRITLVPFIEKLTEFAMELEDTLTFSQSDSASTSFHSSTALDLPRLMLNEMRWLDVLVEPERITSALFESISVIPFKQQQEVIQALPELLDDSASSAVVQHLQSLLKESPSLSTAILDAMASLPLSDEQLAAVRTETLANLAAYPPSNIPAVLKFLLSTTTPATAKALLIDLRRNLHFDSLALDEARDAQSFTIEVLKSGVQLNRTVADAWLALLRQAKSAADHMVVDLIVLLILRAQRVHKKVASALLVRKTKSRAFPTKMWIELISKHNAAVKPFFQSLIAIADALMRANDLNCQQAASEIYRTAFQYFDVYCRQEVVGCLLTHIGGGVQAEVNNAMEILQSLSVSHTEQLSRFLVFLKGTLDYLKNLSVHHIRLLFSILTRLEGDTVDGIVSDEVYILIRKMLGHTSLQYRKIGVVASITAISTHITRCKDGEQEPKDKSATQLLQLVFDSVHRCAPSKSLFCDELCVMVQTATTTDTINAWISDNLLLQFQTQFLLSKSDSLSVQHSEFQLVTAFGCEATSEGEIILSFLPAMLEAKRCDVAVSLCSQFKLLQLLTKQENEGILTTIDALASCPIWLCEVDTFDAIGALTQDAREYALHTLWYTVNWVREVLNAFSTQTEPELQSHVLERLTHLILLESTLAKCMVQVPSFQPPLAHQENADTQTIKPTRERKPKKDKQAASAQNSVDDEGTQQGSSHANTQQSSTQPGTALSIAQLNFQTFKLYTRELELDVFHALSYRLVKDILDTELDTLVSQRQQITLSVDQLVFLLGDLSRKIRKKLHPPKRSPFGTPSSAGFLGLERMPESKFISWIVDILPHLCQHLEETCQFFLSVYEENDGMIDITIIEKAPNWRPHNEAFLLMLQALNDIISWKGLDTEKYRRLVLKLLRTLAARTSVEQSLDLASATAQTIAYIGNFAKNAPTSEVLVAALGLISSLSRFAASEMRASATSTVLGLSKDALQRQWLADPKKPIRPACLASLLESCLASSPDPMELCQEFVGVALPQLLAEPSADTDEPSAKRSKRTWVSTLYPTMTKSTLLVFYKACLAQCVQSLTKVMTDPITGQVIKLKMDDEQTCVDTLASINSVCRVFMLLVQLTKNGFVRSKAMLVTCVKVSKQFLEKFVGVIMSVLDKCLKQFTGEVIGILKDLQKSTRHLQIVCNHSKIEKDVSLSSHVPALKRNLERLVVRTKAMMESNQCTSAFSVGVLKHKTIDGEQASSQIMAESEDDEDEDEGESDRENDSYLANGEGDSDDAGEADSKHQDQDGPQSDEEMFGDGQQKLKERGAGLLSPDASDDNDAEDAEDADEGGIASGDEEDGEKYGYGEGEDDDEDEEEEEEDAGGLLDDAQDDEEDVDED
eukprot:m.246523 g.246523  ORF g.246523 m.246523 type:complete len:1460 (+) comp15380_c0_seq2:92-4471(+)